MASGRFAPSPTGDLHMGNLRTALVAWLAARSTGGAFLVRMEDLDRVTSSRDHERSQLDDLAALGLDWDGPVLRQSERFDHYHAAIADLTARGLTYPCYCTRREIREAASAPHGSDGDATYPGTCRELSASRRAELERSGRPTALRLRADGARVGFVDRLAGAYEGAVDDVVLRRNDGVPAYNLAVVVDDAAQGIQEVVRGDDLLAVTPAQIHLAHRLGLEPPTHLHVPLAVTPDGRRLAKRDGAVTLAERGARGDPPEVVRQVLLESLGLAGPAGRPETGADLLERFDPGELPRSPWAVPERWISLYHP
ncbi:MAG TPA: tRNA glutamyl-Q(34) synthetase GluQRS [Acidimicrobiales bacterium]